MFANLASQKDRDAKPNKGKRKYLPGSERLAEDENAERHDKNRRQINQVFSHTFHVQYSQVLIPTWIELYLTLFLSSYNHPFHIFLLHIFLIATIL